MRTEISGNRSSSLGHDICGRTDITILLNGRQDDFP